MYKFFSKSVEVEDLAQACMRGDIECVKKLISEGADINGINFEYGDTALSQAAFKGHILVIDLLLTHPVSQYSRNMALILASQAGHVEIVDKLIKSGANVNADASTGLAYYNPLHQAIAQNKAYYNPPLHQAIAQNKLDVFNRLLESEDINLDLEDKDNRIPLLLAAYNDRLEMFKRLIEHGANPDVKNSKGWTAEYMAKQRKNTQIIEYLESMETGKVEKFEHK